MVFIWSCDSDTDAAGLCPRFSAISAIFLLVNNIGLNFFLLLHL